MDANDTANAASGRIDAAEATSGPPHYNLRPRRGREEVAEEDTRQGCNVTDGLGRRTGATVLIHGVDTKTSPSRHEPASGADRGRSPDRRDSFATNRERRASSGSSNAGSEFSSAPGSPVGARGLPHAPTRTNTGADEPPVRAERPGRNTVSRGDMSRLSPTARPVRRAHGSENGAPSRSHRHRSPPLFEDMNWADLEAYRKIHIAFQKQRMLESQVTSRVHELAIRPDSPSLVDEEKEVNPLRARNKSTVFETTASQQPGRDGKHVSRVSRRFLDNIILSYFQKNEARHA